MPPNLYFRTRRAALRAVLGLKSLLHRNIAGMLAKGLPPLWRHRKPSMAFPPLRLAGHAAKPILSHSPGGAARRPRAEVPAPSEYRRDARQGAPAPMAPSKTLHGCFPTQGGGAPP